MSGRDVFVSLSVFRRGLGPLYERATENKRIITNEIPNFDSYYPNNRRTADRTLITVRYANSSGKLYIAVMLRRPEDL